MHGTAEHAPYPSSPGRTGGLGLADDLLRSCSSVARFDEAMGRESSRRSSVLGFIARRAGAAVSALDDGAARPESVARALDDRDATDVERGARAAADATLVLDEIFLLQPGDTPSAERIEALFRTADLSSGRLRKPETDWTIEEDAQAVAEILLGVGDASTPFAAMEALREIWSGGRFFGKGRRMALLLSPWIVATGYANRTAGPCIASAVAADTERARAAAREPDEWFDYACHVTDRSAISSIAMLDDVIGLRASLLTLCPPGRTTSSIEPAIDHLIRRPVVTAMSLSKALGISERGGRSVLERLDEANVVEVVGRAKNRRFVCRRAL